MNTAEQIGRLVRVQPYGVLCTQSESQPYGSLVAAIEEYIRVNNQNHKPFVWTKRADEIAEKLRHCKATPVAEHWYF